VPTISGVDRGDLAYATGFVHAQDRFFQMDLLRRAAAGELSELLVPAALDLDRHHRLHRFRNRALTALAAAPADERRLIELYARGVNAICLVGFAESKKNARTGICPQVAQVYRHRHPSGTEAIGAKLTSAAIEHDGRR
jgi:hypothetical protein